MKYCGEQGCTKLISTGRYCLDHRRRKRKPRKSYKHDNKSLYNSAVWKRLVAFVYERDKGCCQRCGKFVHGKDAHSHHIIPVVKAPHLKLNPDNIKLLCSKCHVIEENKSEQKEIPSYFQ